MSFTVVDQAVRFEAKWYPVVGTSTLYIGEIVYPTADGVDGVGAASGAADTTSKTPPWGIVVGTSNDVPVYDATYHVNSITGVTTQAAQIARQNIGQEGMWAKGDPQPFVLVERILPITLIKGNLYNAAIGVAPTVLTVTTGSSTGVGFTANSCDFSTPVSQLTTVYCRTGANAGLYRHTTDTSATVVTFNRAFPYAIAVGDTFVRVPCRHSGNSYVQTDTTAQFFDVAANPATDYWVIDVDEIDLKESGKETVTFRFNADHFGLKRA